MDAVVQPASVHTASPPSPLALVKGEPLTQLPADLYIPPEALTVFLEMFEGPLDLLLYLIKRNNMDILAISVAAVTGQYLEYIRLMPAAQFELAADYLAMAATLTEIKSRLLLPSTADSEAEEEDPRAALVQRLQAYECLKQAASRLDTLPRIERDSYVAQVRVPDTVKPWVQAPAVHVDDLAKAMTAIMQRAALFEHHHIVAETLSVQARTRQVLALLSTEQFTPFIALYRADEGRLGVIITFMAIMELLKASCIELIQPTPYGQMYIRACS